MSERVKTQIVGLEWEEQGPYCQICGAHMGEYYRDEGTPENKNKHFINPHGYESYSDNTCPKCGQAYRYEENDILDLDDTQLEALRRLQKAENVKCFYIHDSLRASGHQYCHGCGKYIRK